MNVSSRSLKTDVDKIERVQKRASLHISEQLNQLSSFISERELTFTFAMLSPVRLSSVCLSVCLSSVTLVHPSQSVEIFRNVSTAFGISRP